VAEALFYALGLTALYGAGNVIARRHALVAAVHLALTLFALSGVYLLLGFPLLAGLNLLVYAGAILVLFLFVLLLLDVQRDEPLPLDLRGKLGPAAAFLVGIEALALAFASGEGPAEEGFRETTERAGEVLFGKYLFPFEVSGLLLLLGIVAVLVLARRGERRAPPPAAGPGEASEPARMAEVRP
jgi:NADH:ubiquinone oxidoreductase subunit 6 (subunit J)